MGKSITWLNHSALFLTVGNSLIILLTSVSTFLLFKSISIKNSGFINSLSATTFGVYLIHDNDCIRSYLWNHLLVVKNYYVQPYFVLYSVIIILLIFSVCSFIDFLRIKFFEEPFFNKFENRIQMMENSLMFFYNNVEKEEKSGT